jgi:prolyl oligopeptidase
MSQMNSVLYVQDDSHGEKRVLLDPNKLSKDGSTSIADYSPSKDGEIVAYGQRQKGSDWYTIHFLNASNGEHFPDILAKTKFTQLDWTYDHKGIFYTVNINR